MSDATLTTALNWLTQFVSIDDKTRTFWARLTSKFKRVSNKFQRSSLSFSFVGSNFKFLEQNSFSKEISLESFLLKIPSEKFQQKTFELVRQHFFQNIFLTDLNSAFPSSWKSFRPLSLNSHYFLKLKITNCNLTSVFFLEIQERWYDFCLKTSHDAR